MLGTDQIDTLWSALFKFKKEFFQDRLQNKLGAARKVYREEPAEGIRVKEVEAVREVLSEFIITVFADLDFLSKSTISVRDIDSFWERISSHASASFKDWLDKTTYDLNKEKWHGLSELNNNIDDFLDRAVKYHSQVQKLSS